MILCTAKKKRSRAGPFLLHEQDLRELCMSPCRRLCGLLFLGVGTGHFAKVEARTVLAQDYRATEGSEVEYEEHNLQRCVRGKASLEYDDWHEAGSQEEGNA